MSKEDLRVEGRLKVEGWLGGKPLKLIFLLGNDPKPGDNFGKTNHTASLDANAD